MNRRKASAAWGRWGCVICVALAGEGGSAAAEAPPGGGAAGKSVPLPYQFSDPNGNSWMLFGNGILQQQGGPNPCFSQLGQISVNGTGGGPMVRAGQTATVDDKTGEVTLGETRLGGVAIVRRILISKEDGTIRFLDTYHNVGNKELAVAAGYRSNFNFGIQDSKTINDPKKKDADLGWVGLTGNGRAVFQAYAMEGAKAAAKVTYPEGSNQLQAAINLVIPAGRSVTLLHYHGMTDTLARAESMVGGAKAAKVLAGVEPAVRRTLVNAHGRTSFGEELEVLRGDALDVVETRSGDLLKGTIQDATYPLVTMFGRVELPAAKIVGVVMLGRQRPLELVLTSEGEVFGGQPERAWITMALSSGQTVKVPVAQVARAGYRRRDGEGGEGQAGDEQSGLAKPAVILRTGERMAIAPPAEPIEVATRFGVLKLDPRAVREVILKGDESPVHIVLLTDGSRISGLLTRGSFDLTLDGAAGPAKLAIPTAALARLRPNPLGDDPGSAPPTGGELRCAGDDLLCGVIGGSFEMDTAFEAVTVRGDQVKAITRPGGGGEVAVTLWDGSLLTGEPRTRTLEVKLGSGVAVQVPLDLLESYGNAAARPSDEMSARVRAWVTKLGDDDFKARETAQAALIAAGPGVAPVLREMRATAPAEAQQRIDLILAGFEGK